MLTQVASYTARYLHLIRDSLHHRYLQVPSQDIPLCIAYQHCHLANAGASDSVLLLTFACSTNYYVIIIIIIIGSKDPEG